MEPDQEGQEEPDVSGDHSAITKQAAMEPDQEGQEEIAV